MKKDSVLIRNAIRTPDGTVIQSHSRHDYITYTDTTNGKVYMIDGGLDYVRRSAHGDEVNMSLYSDEPFEVQREVVVWGSYGLSGREPLKRIAIKDMGTDHIQNVLKNCSPRQHIKDCMQEELKFRSENLEGPRI